MVVVAAVLLVLAVALGVGLLRTRSQLDATRRELADAVAAREGAEAARRTAEADVAAARGERDDAVAREKRAKREAADVARRLKDEHDARAAAEAAHRDADEAHRAAEAATARLEADLAAAESAVVAGGAADVEELWALALAGVQRTWEVSVAPSPGMSSPLEGADDPLRAAIGIEVDAAREEAGAAIDLEWSGEAVAPPAVGLRALSIAQELIARLAKASEEAVLRVASAADGVTIEVEGTDADGRSVVPDDVAAEHQVGPGRYLLSA